VDALLAVLEGIDLFLLPKGEHERRWHRIGCLVTLFFGAIIAPILILLFFAGGF
jgi:uncharacterized protein YjeT (DUF2065 family)